MLLIIIFYEIFDYIIRLHFMICFTENNDFKKTTYEISSHRFYFEKFSCIWYISKCIHKYIYVCIKNLDLSNILKLKKNYNYN